MGGVITDQQTRVAALNSGKKLEYFTIVWHLLEGGISVSAGVIAGSLSLVGFGVDSLIELVSGLAMLRRIKVDHRIEQRERNEKLTLKFIGWCFMALAVYLIFESMVSLVDRQAPERSRVGIIIALLSLVVMPLISRAKRNVGDRPHSPSNKAHNHQPERRDDCADIALLWCLPLHQASHRVNHQAHCPRH